MIEVDQYQRIRFMFAVEGHSQRAIAKTLGVSRNTVRKYCQGAVPPGEREPTQRTAAVADAVRKTVQEWLQHDAAAPRKQRHTAQRSYDRLVAEHDFTGGSSTIRRLVRALRDSTPEAYLPLEFSPGEAGQVDWGAAQVWLDEKPVEGQFFCLRLCYSGAPFVVAFPRQQTEFFLEGHRLAVACLGGVPVRLIYEYVPRNIFVILFPTGLCSGGPRQTTDAPLRHPSIPAVGHITMLDWNEDAPYHWD